MSRPLLVTGGLGFVGSHAVVALAAAGREVVILDNLHNCKPTVHDRLQRIIGSAVPFHRCDIRDATELENLFARYEFGGVMHFAGLKAVGESVAEPLRYFDNNIAGTITLLEAMRRHDVRRMVFSSSCTVYGAPDAVPVGEDAPLRTTNPYGRTKHVIEQMLGDLAASDPDWRIAMLRYFNPVGAHPSGLIGEDPQGVPSNLLPYIAQVAAGQRAELAVHGDDYPTPDGTGVRDYIHVCDLAEGHVAAQRFVDGTPGLHAFNLGSGRGHSVLELVRAFEQASGRPVPYRIGARRPGDIAMTYADPARARALLGWSTRRGLDEICADAWRWQQRVE